MNVLVVEDIPDVALTFAALIRAYGHRTQVAYDGASALRIAREFRPHTVFVDIGLPEMDGYEVAARMRAVPGLDKAHYVSVSGQNIDEARWQQAGFALHLQKPITIDALLEILADEPSGHLAR